MVVLGRLTPWCSDLSTLRLNELLWPEKGLRQSQKLEVERPGTFSPKCSRLPGWAKRMKAGQEEDFLEVWEFSRRPAVDWEQENVTLDGL